MRRSFSSVGTRVGSRQAGGAGGSPFGGGGHRYWRINVSAVDGGFQTSITEIQLRTTEWDASSNVATGGTASASNESFGAAANAFDGSLTTFWRGAGTSNWIAYDFGAGVTHDVVQVVLTGGGAATGENPKDFTIEYSDDGSEWTTLGTVTGETGWISTLYQGHPEARAFNASGRDHVPTLSRYFAAIFPNPSASGSVVRIDEIVFRETSGGANITGGTISSDTGTAADAVDGNNTTFWQGFPTPTGLFMDWGSGNEKDVTEVLITGDGTLAPTTLGFWRSADAVVYDNIWSPASQSGWGSPETRTFTKP